MIAKTKTVQLYAPYDLRVGGLDIPRTSDYQILVWVHAVSVYRSDSDRIMSL